VARNFSARWILTHKQHMPDYLNSFQLRFVVDIPKKIFEGFKKENRLPGLAGGNEFGFEGRQRDNVLTAAFPRDRSAIHHKDSDITCVCAASFASPICVNPTPEFTGVARATSVSLIEHVYAPVLNQVGGLCLFGSYMTTG